jgi:hypothetical protein
VHELYIYELFVGTRRCVETQDLYIISFLSLEIRDGRDGATLEKYFYPSHIIFFCKSLNFDLDVLNKFSIFFLVMSSLFFQLRLRMEPHI